MGSDRVPVEELEGLADRWREKAPDREDSQSRRTAKLIANQCADELEELIEDGAE